jgi:pimeloyl-ACP methyl ester carboxylesterase
MAGIAPAAMAAKRCVAPPGGRCLTVRVPLDHSGGVPGHLRLHVVRVPTPHSPPAGRRTALVPIVGGPGLAATQFADYYKVLVGNAMRGRDLVLWDQRGTGQSDPLHCPSLEQSTNLGGPAAAYQCATALGPARAFFRTQDTVDDLEAVRRKVGARRLLLFGFSYGTRVALQYAAKYPRHVEAIVLDGPVAPEGVDALHQAGYNAVPAMLRSLCVARCAAVTPDVVRDLVTVAQRLNQSGVDVTEYGDDGSPRTVGLTAGTLFGLIETSDQIPMLRGAFPAALHAAAAGDFVPLTRLAADSAERHSAKVDTTYYSPAAYAATQCTEAKMPFDRRTQDPSARWAQVQQTIQSTPADAYWPFTVDAAAASPLMRMCLGWPYDDRPELPALTPANKVRVRALILSGDADLTTPPVNARLTAAVIARPSVVEVPDGGHGVLETSPCARRALAVFLTGRTLNERCPRDVNFIKVWPLLPKPDAPVSADDIFTIARQTLWDVRRRIELSLATRKGIGGKFLIAGGLRGGMFIARDRHVTLLNVVLFPGVPVSGKLKPGGTLQIGDFGTAKVDRRGNVVSATTTDGRTFTR